MSRDEFEQLLTRLCETLTAESTRGVKFDKSATFERRVREVLQALVEDRRLTVDFDPHPFVFPDILLETFGIEVKFTTKNTWRSVANSVLESFRDPKVQHVYVVFGKMGGAAEVRWGRYEDCVIHVRTSHMPRFELEIAPTRQSLFGVMSVSYQDFCKLPIHERMTHIRKYARSRLVEGERLWWLEDQPNELHTLPIHVSLYTSLSAERKRQLRAEGALLCPQVVKSSRSRKKYNDVTLYLLTYHGVLCHQARDLFSAGSVAGPERGGNYMLKALRDIEAEMTEAARRLDDALFVEYWGRSIKPKDRIGEWLKRADDYAAPHWVPSKELFRTE